MRHALAFATLLVLGCGGSKPAPAPAAPPAAAPTSDARAKCAAAIAQAAKTGRGEEQFSPEDQKLNTEVEATMTDGCAATSWPEPVLTCLSTGTSRDELRLCTEMLSDVQRQDFMDRVLAVTKQHEAAAEPAPAQ